MYAERASVVFIAAAAGGSPVPYAQAIRRVRGDPRPPPVSKPAGRIPARASRFF